MTSYTSLEDKILEVLESEPERWWSPNEIIYEACADGGMPSSVRVYLSKWQRSILDKLEYRSGPLKKTKTVFYRLKSEKDAQCIHADDDDIQLLLDEGLINIPVSRRLDALI